MNKMFRVALAVSVCVCGLAPVSSARQQGARPRRGGLDKLSLPSTTERLRGPSLPEGWQVFEPEGAGFRVAAPSGLEELTQKGRAEGRLAAGFRQYQVADEGAEYGVGRTGAILRAVEPAEYFASVREMMAARGGAPSGKRGAKIELVRERVVALDGREGREFEMAGDGRRALVRCYLIEGSVYTLAVDGPAASFPEEKARVFLDSFRLSARP